MAALKPEDLRVEMKDAGEITPHPHNPRNGDVDAIKESMEANGIFAPVTISRDGVILIGNHRYMAMVELGHRDIPCITLPVEAATDAALRIMLADNRTSDRARYDEGALLTTLELLGDQLFGTAFVTDDVEMLRHLLDGPLADDFDSGETPDDISTMTLHIPGLTTAELGRFRALPGETDLAKLLGLMNRAND